jgi:Asp-tRNA(Asn)/Glu-tRNA(Gln) amidotransferase A subunit family amidase
MPYESTKVEAPRTAGRALKMLVGLAESGVTRKLIARIMLPKVGIAHMRTVLASESAVFRVPTAADRIESESPNPVEAASAFPTAPDDYPFETAADFVAAYLNKQTTPKQVAQRILEATTEFDAMTPPMRVFIAQTASDLLAQAEASTQRYRAGRPLGPLDGVPVAVKDELDQAGYPTTVGTRFLGGAPAKQDATAVQRLRDAGALLVGKANMHEIGIGVTGVNPNHGTARNPYNPAHATGGSSSGSAAAVASGLCPIAVGADGGGSIRIPASFCGIYGLKPTFGRVSEHGIAPVCWSVAHAGPLAASVRDLALAFAVMSGADPHDPLTLSAPPVRLESPSSGRLDGVRLGIYSRWFEDADPAVVGECRRMLEILRGAGATVVEIVIPDLDLVRSVHLVTIVSEMASAHDQYYAAHRKDYALDTRLNLALARGLTSTDFVHAQRLRNRIRDHVDQVLRQVDVIVTPTTGITSPVHPLDALAQGESDLPKTLAIMRFAQLANLTGYPAISFPSGYDDEGMPVGMQAMGRPFDEALLLRLAAVAEAAQPRRQPKVHVELLPKP